MQVLRTPEDRFADLPGFGYPPRYADVGELRLAYVEAGPPGGEPVLLLHGEPSWSFLYRRVMPVLADAGLRVIAADLAGFGRSDKPADVADHTYARHVEWIRALAFDRLDLRGLTLVGQDWGGLIGLRLVAEHPDRFARVVAANTGLPTGDQPMPDVWLRFREVVRTAPTLSVSRLVQSGCQAALPPAGQLDIHLGQQPAIQQRVVRGARRQIDAETLAEFVQRIPRARDLRLGDFDRVDGAGDGNPRTCHAQEFGVQEFDVERRIVDDQRRVTQEFVQLVGDVGKERLVGEELIRQSMHAL